MKQPYQLLLVIMLIGAYPALGDETEATENTSESTELEECRDDLGNSQAEGITLYNKLNECKQLLSRTRRQCDAALSPASEAQIDELEIQVAEQSQRITELETTLQECTTQKNNLEQQLTKCAIENNNCDEADLKTCQADLAQCQDQLQRVLNKPIELGASGCETELTMQNGQWQATQRELQNERARNSALQSRLETCERKPTVDCPPTETSSVVATLPAAGCDLAKLGQYRQLLPSMVVFAGEYPIPAFIYSIWVEANTPTVQVNNSFYMMTREVTINDFNHYLKATNQSSVQSKNSSACPITEVSWQQAAAYARWLTKQTGCEMRLPSYQEWLAAVTLYSKPEMANVRPHRNAAPSKLDCSTTIIHLLGNIQEWSRDTQYNTKICGEGGHYVLGNNYLSEKSTQPICQFQKSKTIGFRLIWAP